MDTSGRSWEEGPRVRERPRVVRRGVAAPPLAIDPIGIALRDVERRFLTAQGTDAGAPPANVSEMYLAILADLRAIDARLQELVGRRDIPYFTDRQLSVLTDHCRWLTRRVSTELVFSFEVSLEQHLRELIDAEAYQVYLRLEDLEEAARDLDRLDDGEMMTRLREGTLVLDVLDEVRQEDVCRGKDRQLTPGAAPGGE